MRKLLFILLIIPIAGFSQTDSITGALGLTFGINKKEAKSIIKHQYGNLMASSNNSLIGFNKNVFGIDGASIDLSFTNTDKLNLIIVRYNKDDLGVTTLWELYNKLKGALLNKYGVASDSSRDISRQYFDQIKNEAPSQIDNSVTQGLESFSTTWLFGNANNPYALINISVKNGDVTVSYMNSIGLPNENKINTDGM